MKKIGFILILALFLISPGKALNAAPQVDQVPEKGILLQGPKLPADNSRELLTFPEPNDVTTPQAGATPQAVFRNGCIFFPGARVSFRLNARNLVLYRVVPSRFFDVTMRVTYVGLRSFFVDRFFGGGAERILIRGPNFFWPVVVTIGGFRGSTGCFAFSATP